MIGIKRMLIFIQLMTVIWVAIATANDSREQFLNEEEEEEEVDFLKSSFENEPTYSPHSLQKRTSDASSADDNRVHGLNLPQCRMGYRVMSYFPIEKSYYHHQTCFWCYFFTPKHRKKYNLNITQERIVLSDGIPRLDIKFSLSNESSYHFDLFDPLPWAEVTRSMGDSLEVFKLEQCCREAIQCCTHNLRLSNQTITTTTPHQENICPGTWDGWSCFPDTPGGETISFKCPSFAYKGQPDCTLEGHKTCWANGTWARDERGIEQTDYAPCSHRLFHLLNYWWEVAMHAISMLALAPAIFILHYYRALRAQRFKLHLNFFWALFFKAFFSLLDMVVLRIPEYTESNTLMDDNTGGCKFLVFLSKVFSVAVWTWMLAESLYIHRLIVAAFKGGGKTYVYVIIGWVPPVVLSVSWAISRALLEDYQCWLGDDHSDNQHLYLITELPKLIILAVNAILLANMTRVLLTTLKGVNPDGSASIRKAVKATVFLLPMFGLQFFMTLIVPPFSTPCNGMLVYTFIAIGVDGLQGLYVAVVYCFINAEVKNQVVRSVHQLTGTIYTSLGTSSYATYDPKTEVSQIHSSVYN